MLGSNLFGYIDPGSGFILLQVIVAGAIGGMLYFRKLMWKAASLVTGWGRKAESPAGTDPEAVAAQADLASDHPK